MKLPHISSAQDRIIFKIKEINYFATKDCLLIYELAKYVHFDYRATILLQKNHPASSPRTKKTKNEKN